MLNEDITKDLRKIADCLCEIKLQTSEAKYILQRLIDLNSNLGILIDVHDIAKNEVNKYE